MTKKRIFLLCGHPDKESTAGKLLDSYERGALEAGHEVRRINLGESEFDPILHRGYKVIQELEPDLKKIQENITWCEHWVIAYPNWWGAMPALLKGMFDRMFLPGFAFKFRKDSTWWDKLLTKKTARVIITMDNHPLIAAILFGNTSNEIRRATLGFAGIGPVRLTRFGMVRFRGEEKKKAMIERVGRLGKQGL